MGSKPKAPSPAAYSVGYGKPPVAKQFQKGVSGNPKGRPKGQPSPAEPFLKEAARLIKAKTPDGKIVEMTKQAALARKVFDLALQGDLGAMRLVMFQLQIASAEDGASHPPESPLTPDELAVLDLFKTAGK